MTWRDIQEALLLGLTPTQQRSVLFFLFVMGFMVHVLHAHGLPPFENGFAREDQIEEVADRLAEAAAERAKDDALRYITQVEGSIRDLHTEILEERIQSLQIQRCRADDPNLRQQYAARVNRNMSKYREINGYYYNITPCQEM